jgi:hypothetical protein
MPAARLKRGGTAAMRRILSPARHTLPSVRYLPEKPMDKKPLDPAILKRIHEMTGKPATTTCLTVNAMPQTPSP